eukprot:829254-Prymnesium_polylepis.1
MSNAATRRRFQRHSPAKYFAVRCTRPVYYVVRRGRIQEQGSAERSYGSVTGKVSSALRLQASCITCSRHGHWTLHFAAHATWLQSLKSCNKTTG